MPILVVAFILLFWKYYLSYVYFSLSVFFFFLAMPRGLWDLSSPTRDCTRATAVRAQNPNH